MQIDTAVNYLLIVPASITLTDATGTRACVDVEPLDVNSVICNFNGDIDTSVQPTWAIVNPTSWLAATGKQRILPPSGNISFE